MRLDTALTAQPTLLDPWLAPGRDRLPWRRVLAVIMASGLLWISAKVQIPFWPVPMTMQTFVVLMVGIAFGTRLGLAAVALYLLEGAVGLPVFAGTPERGIGLAYMMGPTGGYLVGFLAAAGLCGWLAERGWDRNLGRMLVAASVGHVIILAFGWAWLALQVGSMSKAYALGVAPFHVATLVKTLLAAGCVPLAWRLLGSRRG
jgi:biotin transport system substrate-specific component